MLDEKLLQQRLEQYNPEPLIDYDPKIIKENIEKSMVENDENNIDLAKANYLNVLNNEVIKKVSEDIIREYGVGTCGPRAFYGKRIFNLSQILKLIIIIPIGTTDVHLELEQCIAKFLGLEESIVYSYGFVAISSSIAAYCKKNDVIFVDEHANFPIQQGLLAAKSKVIYFKHNDAEDFRLQVEKLVEKEKKTNRSARKFLVIEGVSWKTGKICPLVEFLKVAEQHKMRIFLEETYSLGVLGENGRGLTEYFDVDPERFDMIFGTLEAALGSIGGFCAGAQLTIEHQRLSGSGYIFSASLPTYLVKAAIKSIELLNDKPRKLVEFAVKMHKFLENECDFDVISDPQCPFKMFTVKNVNENNKREHEKKFINIVKIMEFILF